MKDIIEKLGITPLEGDYYDEIGFVYATEDIEQLEQQRNELLENLFDTCKLVCKLCIRLNPQHVNCPECDELNDLRKPITEKTGKTWEEIKELFNE